MGREGRLTVGDLARRAGISPQGIRFYEAEGLLPAPPRTAAGYRIYDPSALGRLQFIRRGRQLGLSLVEIKEVMGLARSRKAPCCRVRELLGEKLRDLDQRIAELVRFRDQLRDFFKQIATMPDQADTSQQVCALIEMAPDLPSLAVPLGETVNRRGGNRAKGRAWSSR